MITMQEMEKELAIYRKNFTAVRLISEADILRTIEARKHNPASRACPCRDGRMTSQGCRNCIVSGRTWRNARKSSSNTMTRTFIR